MKPETVKNILAKSLEQDIQKVEAEIVDQLIIQKRSKVTFMYRLDDIIIDYLRSEDWVVTTEKVEEDHRRGTFTYVCYP